MAVYQHRYGRVGWFFYSISKLYAWLFGWKVIGEEPEERKAIGIIAPHTSNWDVLLMFVMANCMRLKSNWLAKDNLLKPPFGFLFRALGAIPVDRASSQNVVDQVADIFANTDQLYLAVAPDGTRKKTDYWRTGFYWMALKAEVPVVLMYIDYAKKEVGFGDQFYVTGDIEKDFQRFKAFYDQVTPKHPALRSDVRLRDDASRKAPPSS